MLALPAGAGQPALPLGLLAALSALGLGAWMAASAAELAMSRARQRRRQGA